MTLPFLGDDVLQSFADFMAENMPQHATLYTAATTTIAGRTVTTYVVRATSPVRVSSLGEPEHERLMAGAVASAVFVALYFPVDVDIRQTDRVLVLGTTRSLDDDAPVAWMRTFSIVALDHPGVAVSVQRRAVAQEVA